MAPAPAFTRNSGTLLCSAMRAVASPTSLEMIPPTATTPSRSISRSIARAPSSALDWSSATTSSSRRPSTPPAWLTSFTASCIPSRTWTPQGVKLPVSEVSMPMRRGSPLPPSVPASPPPHAASGRATTSKSENSPSLERCLILSPSGLAGSAATGQPPDRVVRRAGAYCRPTSQSKRPTLPPASPCAIQMNDIILTIDIETSNFWPAPPSAAPRPKAYATIDAHQRSDANIDWCRVPLAGVGEVASVDSGHGRAEAGDAGGGRCPTQAPARDPARGLLVGPYRVPSIRGPGRPGVRVRRDVCRGAGGAQPPAAARPARVLQDRPTHLLRPHAASQARAGRGPRPHLGLRDALGALGRALDRGGVLRARGAAGATPCAAHPPAMAGVRAVVRRHVGLTARLGRPSAGGATRPEGGARHGHAGDDPGGMPPGGHPHHRLGPGAHS